MLWAWVNLCIFTTVALLGSGIVKTSATRYCPGAVIISRRKIYLTCRLLQSFLRGKDCEANKIVRETNCNLRNVVSLGCLLNLKNNITIMSHFS
jgi:hypothetical protein